MDLILRTLLFLAGIGSGVVVVSLVLLHTLRTQLDLFEKVVPQLASDFTVFAFDYPGHRYSDIPDAKYDAEFFAGAVAGFLDTLGLRDVTLAGVSIGASTAVAQHPATFAERDVPRRQSYWPLSRVPGLLRNAASWQAATREYQNIGIPVLLVWGRERLGAGQRTRTRPAAHSRGSHDCGRARRAFPASLDRPRRRHRARALRNQRRAVVERNPQSGHFAAAVSTCRPSRDR